MIFEFATKKDFYDRMNDLTSAIWSRVELGTKTTVEIKDNAYTSKQRGSLHIWCEQCAKALNDAGIPCRRLSVFGDQQIEIPWSMGLFKEVVYKPVLEAITGKQSTEDQSTVEPSDIAMIISKQYSENGLICPPWPSFR